MKQNTSILILPLLITSISCASARTRPEASLETREGMREINGTRLFVRDVGPREAPLLIVIHGGPGGNHLSLRPLEQLAPRFRVIFYDQRGTGGSDRLPISTEDPNSLDLLTLEKNIEDLEQLRRNLGYEKVSLLGHSFGGALATFYTAAFPQRVERLVIYSGGPENKDLSQRKSKEHFSRLSKTEKAQVLDITKKLQERAEVNAPQEELDHLFLGLVKLMLPSLNCKPHPIPADLGRAGFWANQTVGRYIETFDPLAFSQKLRQIPSPTLLIWGRCEPSPQERLLYLLDHIPNAQLAVFENSGHNAMEEEPDLFFETVRAFLHDQPIGKQTYRSREALSP